MTHFPQPHPTRRSPRVQLGGSVPAAINLDGDLHTRGKLQCISITGGLLELSKAFRRGDFVEVAFPTHSGAVHGMAEMLSPTRKQADLCLQPFRFIALADDDHRKLRMALDSAFDHNYGAVRNNRFQTSTGL